MFRKMLIVVALAASSPANAETVSICNDAGDTCIVHRGPLSGSFENPIHDNYPWGEYPIGKMEKVHTPGPGRGKKDSAVGAVVLDGKQKNLARLGVSHQDASEWERLDKVSEDQFEKVLKMPLPSARKIVNGNRNPVSERLAKLPKYKSEEPLPPKVKRKSRLEAPMNIVVGGEIVGVLNPEQGALIQQGQ